LSVFAYGSFWTPGPSESICEEEGAQESKKDTKKKSDSGKKKE